MDHANTTTGSTRTRDTRLGLAAMVILVVLAMTSLLIGGSGTAHAATQVNLGSASAFAVLAGSTITNTGSTTLTGSAGLHPGTSVTGFDSVTFVSGQLHVADTTAASAKDDLVTAYNSAAGQGPATTIATELGGELLKGGVYNSSSGTFGLTGTLRLDAQGTAGTVWIFQTASTLITEVNSSVVLLNGADPCNVFWKVGSSATLKTGTSFQGNILALESITLGNSATIEGRALARNGAVTMDRNTITRANCPASAPPPAPAPSPTPSPAPAPSPSPSPSPSPAPSPTPSPTTAPAPVASPSPIAVPVDSTTGTPDAPTDTTGAPDAPTGATGSPDGPTTTPGAPDEPDVPVAAAPPASGTPQVPAVPRGPVPAGDGSMATADRGAPGILLLPVLAGAVLFASWRRRNA